MERDDYLTLKEVMDLLRISKSTAYNLVQKNKIPAVQIGGSWRISREGLIKFLNEDIDSKEQIIKILQDRIAELEKAELYARQRFNSFAVSTFSAQIGELEFCISLLKK